MKEELLRLADRERRMEITRCTCILVARQYACTCPMQRPSAKEQAAMMRAQIEAHFAALRASVKEQNNGK